MEAISLVSKDIGGAFQPVNLSMSVMKPLGATWLINTYNYIKANPSIIVNGFKTAGIL